MEHIGRTEWFNTSCVVRKILGYFSNQKILAFSLINHTWNFEAKSLFKSRGKTVAKLKGLKTCAEVVQFAKVLEAMTTAIPYSGLDVNVTVSHSGSCAPFDEHHFNVISSGFPLKVFKIAAQKEETKTALMRLIPRTRCSALRSVNQLLLANIDQLVELDVVVPVLAMLRLELILGFPQLKILKFDCVKFSSASVQPRLLHALKVIVERSPKLEQLHLAPHQPNARRWLEGVVPAVLHGSRAILVCEQIEFSTLLKLSAECLQHLGVRNVVEKRTAWMLLRNSSRTLQTALLDSFSITQVVLEGASFVNLQNLKLSLHPHFLQSLDGQKIFSKTAWTRAFPKLRSLSVSVSSKEDRDYCKLLNVLMRMLDQVKDENLEGPKKRQTLPEVKKLRVRDRAQHGDLSSTELSFLCDLCPHVKTLCVENLESFLDLFASGLKYITELELILSNENNIDWILCGIDPSEADNLMQEQVEVLRKLHVVPTQESITNFKCLKTLTFRVYPRVLQGGDFVFSAVTAGLCFSRMPGLTVKLQVSSSLAQDAIRKDFMDVMKEFPEVRIQS